MKKTASRTHGSTTKPKNSSVKNAKGVLATKADKGKCTHCKEKIEDLFNITFHKFCSTSCFIDWDKKRD